MKKNKFAPAAIPTPEEIAAEEQKIRTENELKEKRGGPIHWLKSYRDKRRYRWGRRR